MPNAAVPFPNQKTPNLLTYGGSVVINPTGSNHPVVPYGSAARHAP
jgi:hypothetical protein